MANKDFFYDQFRACKTVEEAKSLYRKLSKQYHPDLGGDTETFKVLGNVFEDVIKNFVFTAFSESGDRAKRHSANIFADILAKIIKFNITIEIIGFWIYAFNSYEYREQLKDLGFWFSRKHKAWVYNGDKCRKYFRTNLTLNQVRNYHGSEVIKEKEELEKIEGVA